MRAAPVAATVAPPPTAARDSPSRRCACGNHAPAGDPCRNIVFAPGRFDPQAAQGRRLLAHELTHVVQQSAALPAGPLTLARDDTAEERAADEQAERIAGGAAADSRTLGSAPAPLRSARATSP